MIAPIRAFLYQPSFPDFTIQVKGIGTRKPDFHFHPSQHPSWVDRALYIWMTDPDLLLTELYDPMAVLSMTAGSIWHEIIEHICLELGLVDAVEVRVSDPEHKTRGSMDGVRGDEVWEFKTAKDQMIAKIKTVDDYLRLYPTYHLQANEYMRMSGLFKERVLLMALTFPYDMREFVIEYDLALAHETVTKYERVLQAVDDGRIPMCSGCLGICPARAVCQAMPNDDQMIVMRNER